jgi:hypothetical protein
VAAARQKARNGIATGAQPALQLGTGVLVPDSPRLAHRQEDPMTALLTDDVRTEALFVSDLQRSERPSPESIREAVLAALDRLGAGGCAELVAQEFGEHPDCALGRMQWARNAIRTAWVG